MDMEMPMRPLLVLFSLLISLFALPASAQPLSDTQIRQLVIKESIASYSSVCACPYSIMRNGRACGRRSAYSRPGGYAPLCYPADVTQAQVDAYRRSHGG